MISMASRDIFPAAAAFSRDLAETISAIREAAGKAPVSSLEQLLTNVCRTMEALTERTGLLEKALSEANQTEDLSERGKGFRESGDSLERLVAKKYWPFPTYEDLLFRL